MSSPANGRHGGDFDMSAMSEPARPVIREPHARTPSRVRNRFGEGQYRRGSTNEVITEPDPRAHYPTTSLAGIPPKDVNRRRRALLPCHEFIVP